jgi:RHS repeat-associated protein
VRSDYGYDGGNRLTRATNRPGGSYDYTYDANGNRTSVKTNGTVSQSLTFNSANQITSTGRAYDGAGNQTTNATSAGTLAYNAAGQMTKVGAQPYDYAGPTQDEILAPESADIVYGRTDQYGLPWIQSYVQYYDDGSTTTGYIDRDGRGTPLGVTIDGLDYFYVTDRLGSITALIGTDAAVAASYSYDPYGVLKTSSGIRAEDNPLRFTGAYLDKFWGLGTGFTKLGTRWNNTAEGRFTQQDPVSQLANPADGNRYAYAADDPCNNTDPTGESVCSMAVLTAVYALGAAFFGVLWAAGGGVVLGIAISGATAGAISSALAGAAAVEGLLASIFCD